MGLAIRADMKAHLVHRAEGHRRTFVRAFDKGEDPLPLLNEFARREQLRGSQLTAVGAFEQAVLGYFDRTARSYRRNTVDQQVEVLSFLGDIAHTGTEPAVHVHVVLGLADGTTRGGHLLEARVWPTLEVVLSEWPEYLCKALDPDVGLPLIAARDQRR